MEADLQLFDERFAKRRQDAEGEELE